MQLGEASAQILVGEEAKKMVKATEFMQGLTSAWGSPSDFETVFDCLSNNKDAVAVMQPTIERLSNMETISDKVAATVLALTGVTTVQRQFHECTAMT